MITSVKRGNVVVDIESLFVLMQSYEWGDRYLYIRADTEEEACDLARQEGYASVEFIGRYGLNLTQKGVVFVCVEVERE